MHKIMLIAAIAAALTGCQTRITATKNAEVAHPIQHVVKVNGEDQVIVDQYHPLYRARRRKGAPLCRSEGYVPGEPKASE